MSQRFQKVTEDFVCSHCGRPVEGSGYTNHCPDCLYSRHVDINPGDRAEVCGGMMEPVGVIMKGGEVKIEHCCLKCGVRRSVKSTEGDNWSVLVELSN